MKTKNEKSIEQGALEDYLRYHQDPSRPKHKLYSAIIALIIGVLIFNVARYLLYMHLNLPIVGVPYIIIMSFLAIMVILIVYLLYVITLSIFTPSVEKINKRIIALLSEEKKKKIITDYVVRLIAYSKSSVLAEKTQIEALSTSISNSEKAIEKLEQILKTI